MTALADIRTAHKSAGALHSLLAPTAFLNDTTVLTKSGDVFMTLSLTGRDAECLEEAEIAEIVQRFATAIRTLGPEYRVYQYLMKQHSPDIPQAGPPDEVQRNRIDFLKGRGRNLYSVRLYLVVLRIRQATESSPVGFVRRFSVRCTTGGSVWRSPARAPHWWCRVWPLTKSCRHMRT
jgi:type IV secretory pathway VirB4 component